MSINPSSAPCFCSPGLCAKFLQNLEVVLRNMCHDSIKTIGFEGFSQLCCVFQFLPAILTVATSAGTMATIAAVSGLSTQPILKEEGSQI